MALIQCPECGKQVSDKAPTCVGCGCPLNQERAAAPAVRDMRVEVRKSRGLYIILGLLFGYAGFHNFYSGNNVSGAVKIALCTITLLIDASTGFYSGFFFIALAICCIWALVELFAVKTDAAGVAMG